VVSATDDKYSPKQQTTLKDEQSLIPGYTTKDDAGDDGDDTLHAPISFYRVPNCIEARIGTCTSTDKEDGEKPVESVDLVYLEFIEPWILLALRFLGAEYELKDTEVYADGVDFTTMIAMWVQENWKGEC